MVCKDIEYSIYWLVLSHEFYLGSFSDFRDLEFAETITESLQTLRRIKLAVSLLFWDGDPLKGICDTLEEISGRNKLECIEIHLTIMRYEYMGYYVWHRLEDVLIKSGWPKLNCVSITITFEYPRPSTNFQFPESLQHAHLPRLRTIKHLDLKFSAEYST